MSASVVAWVATAITAVSAYNQYEAGQDAQAANERQVQAQKEGIAAQGRSADVESHRARIAQNREARIRRANVLASTGAMAEGNSGVLGAAFSTVSQEASNIGLIGQTQTFAQEASAANQRAADASGERAKAQAIGQQWGAIGSLATTVLGGSLKRIRV